METHRYIAIGITRYHFLQPLSYAQADAQAIYQFWLQEAQLPPHQSLLLTETSAEVDGKSTVPNRETVLYWLTQSLNDHRNHFQSHPQFSSSSVSWLFFSGYGANYQGQDYLMPIDGNPRDIPGTGIGLRSLFELLQKQGTEEAIAILDINRSPGIIGSKGVGQQAIALAQEMGIALVLSAQPDQFSYEAAALGQGTFTAALLEALHTSGQNFTLAYLDQYLRHRLPELSEHHWRPVQEAVIICPMPEIYQQPLLGVTQKEGNLSQVPESSQIVELSPLASENFLIPPTQLNNHGQTLITEAQRLSSNPVPPKARSRLWWFLAGGSAALLMAILVPKLVSFNQQPQKTTQTTSKPETTSEEPTTPDSQVTNPSQPPVSQPTDVNRELLNQARIDLQSNQVSNFTQAIEEARKIQPDSPLYQEAQGDIARWSRVILDVAQGRAKQGDFAGAIAAGQQVPSDQSAIYALAQEAIARWKVQVQQQQVNQTLLEAAEALIKPNEASSYNRAIITLRKIAVGEPSYEQAQELIAKWGEQIYLIAESRAAAGDWQQAIETAMLVPPDTPAYKLAEAAIAKWKQGNP